MVSEGRELRLGEGGGEGQRKQLAEGQIPLCLWCGYPWGFRGGGCKAFLLMIGQFTLLYPVFSPFWGVEEAAACGYIKLPGRIPGRGDMHGVLTKVPGVKDCVSKSDCALSIGTMARPEGSGIRQIQVEIPALPF